MKILRASIKNPAQYIMGAGSLGSCARTRAKDPGTLNRGIEGMMTRRWLLGTLVALVVSLVSYALAAEGAPLSNAEPALERLSTELADQNLPLAQRLEIVRVFGAWATGQVRAPLLATLKDPAPELRAAAARALGWPGNGEAIGALRQRVEMAGETAAVRAAAVHALGIIGDPSTRALLVAATREADAGVRQAALWSVSLGPLGDPADRTSYLIQITEDQALDGLLRCDAIRALVQVKEDRIVEVFIRVLEREPHMTIALPEATLSQPQIMELRRVQARDVAAWAAAALGELRAKGALTLLLKTAEDPSDFFLRQMSITSLIALGAHEAGPVYMRRLEDRLPENRALAILGLTELADKAAIDSVRPRLNDQDSLVRAQAVVALGTLGDATVRPVLEALQRNELDSQVLGALEIALSRLPR
jgi:HEAT repeat protein